MSKVTHKNLHRRVKIAALDYTRNRKIGEKLLKDKYILEANFVIKLIL
jgi:hypothetical protein